MSITEQTEFRIEALNELYNPDLERIELAKKRQTAVWEGRKADAPPIIAHGDLSPEQERIPRYNHKEAFYNADFMLCNNVRAAISAADSGSDAVPSMRANMGTGMTLSCLGLEQEVFDDKMPWLKEHLDKEQISRLGPDDIKIQGTFERALNHMRRFKEVMGDAIPIFCPDTQGPFDLAHLILGDDLFLECYDDPPFVRHLLELCVSLGIKTHTWAKEVSGEAKDKLYHGNYLYAENMGIRICEDTTALLNAEQIEQFAMPYTQKLARHFGGAWVHYCGRNDHLAKAVLNIPEVRGINFGHIPGHQHEIPFEQDMELVQETGKVYIGPWPHYDDEVPRDFLKRMHCWASEGVLIPQVNSGSLTEGPGAFSSLEEALAFWYAL
jgi:hypothetical protein